MCFRYEPLCGVNVIKLVSKGSENIYDRGRVGAGLEGPFTAKEPVLAVYIKQR